MSVLKHGWKRLCEWIRGGNVPLSRRWPLIFGFGMLFCFILFPLFLVDVGLDSYLQTRKKLQKKEVFRHLNQKLELLLQFGNSRYYYHALLKRIVENAAASRKPIAYLKQALPHLAQRNPGVFRFIVWNKNGRTIDELTDEKSYKYIVKTVYEVLCKAAEDAVKNYPGNPATIPIVDKRLNLLRSYLGAFFVPERLNLPYLRGNLGECLMASSNPEKSHFWYQVSDEFTIFVNIHVNAIESNDYLKKIVAGMNRNSTAIRYGMADLIKDCRVFTDRHLENREEILVELGKFLNSSESEVETANQLLVIKPITPFVLGFCALPSKNHLMDVKEARIKILGGATLLIISLALIVSYLIFKSGFFSIRWKLALLFIYANGLPLLILGFLGFEYMQQVRAQLLDHAQKQISNLMTDFDTKFVKMVKRYEGQVNLALDKINERFADGSIGENDFHAFVREVSKTNPTDIIVADADGKFKIFNCSGKRADKFIANMAQTLVEYANENEFTPQVKFDDVSDKKAVKAQSVIAGNRTIVFEDILRKTRRIGVQQMAAEERFYYWGFLGDFFRRKFKYLCMISWSQDHLQEIYLKEFMDTLNSNSEQVKFYAMVEANGVTYPGKNVPSEIDNLFRQVFNLKVVKADSLRIGNEKFVGFGSVGKLMNQVALVGALPLQNIDSHIFGLRMRLIAFAFMSIFLTSGIGMLLAKQFLEPVKELELGVRAIGEQNFRYRIPIGSADEFGHLGTVFNRAIESLEDLEVAKIVQENLFPLNPLKHGKLEVFGRSVSMTRLGGDYYDYYEIDKDYAGILMGDVAGHGVPAAMLMAMAKASVLLAENEQKHSPAALLSSLHKVIFKVKSSKIKRMMTCQYFSINVSNGNFKFSNAGHCFPLLVRAKEKKIEQLAMIGIPLGITKKPHYKDQEFSLEEGDIVLLYTDGIIESKNKDGLAMGFDRFEQLVLDSCDLDLENFYQSIFSGYLEWSPEAEDDITMVLLRYGCEGGGVV